MSGSENGLSPPEQRSLRDLAAPPRSAPHDHSRKDVGNNLPHVISHLPHPQGDAIDLIVNDYELTEEN